MTARVLAFRPSARRAAIACLPCYLIERMGRLRAARLARRRAELELLRRMRMWRLYPTPHTAQLVAMTGLAEYFRVLLHRRARRRPANVLPFRRRR